MSETKEPADLPMDHVVQFQLLDDEKVLMHYTFNMATAFEYSTPVYFTANRIKISVLPIKKGCGK